MGKPVVGGKSKVVVGAEGEEVAAFDCHMES
jgi:hypothetical protein